MKQILLLIVIVLLSMNDCNAQIHTTLNQDSILNWIQQSNSKYLTIKCHFKRETKLSSMSQTILNEGEFLFKSPNSLVMNYTSPQGDLMLMNQQSIYMRQNGKLQKMSVSKNPMMRRLHKMLSSCMKGDIQGMGLGKMTVNIQEDKTNYMIELLPQKRTRNLQKIVLFFRKKDAALKQLYFFESDKNSTCYSFFDILFDTPIPNNQLEIDYYL